jgi:hypothetical protein
MSPYLITSIVFGILFVIVYFYVSLPKTIYMPTTEGVQESVEVRKKRAEAIKSKQWMIGVGGVIGLCLLSYFVIWISGPAKRVHAALYPSATPTITNTATITPTRTSTPTPRISPTSRMIDSLQAMSTLTGQPTGPTGTAKPAELKPSGSSGGSVTIIQTRVVIQTRIVYVTQFVVMTVPVTVIVTNTPVATVTVANTATITPTIETATPTVTVTSTSTLTSTPTQTETPVP